MKRQNAKKGRSSSGSDVRRRSQGQAIIEGTVALIVITGIIIGGVLLVIGAGLSVYYKAKLAYAAEIGAKYGGQGSSFLGAKRTGYGESQLAKDVEAAVNAALVGQGLPACKSENIITKQTTVNGVQGIQVTVQEGGLTIISGGLLPSSISLTETAFYPYQNDNPTAILEMSIGGTSASPNGQGLFVPMYGGGSYASFTPAGTPQGPVPTGNIPRWKVAVIGEAVNGLPISRVEKYGKAEVN